MTASTALTIQQLNLAYFGRPADPASQVAFPASGMSDEEIVLAFVKTSEYTAGTITPNSVADNVGGRTFNETSLINTFYQRLFGRLAVASEIAGWSSALARGAVNHDYLGITILRAGLNLPAGTAMRDVLLAKIDSAQAFSDNLASNAASAQAYSTSAAATSAASFLSGVTTSTAATAAEAATAVTAMVATGLPAPAPAPEPPASQSFTLTTGVDVLSGGAAADSFTAGLSTNGTMVLQTADVLSGGEGLDSLSAIFAIGAATTVTPTLNGIESLTINNATTGAFAGTFDASFSPDLTSVTVTPSTAQTLNVNQLQSTAVELGVTTANLASTVAFDFVNTAVTGAADSASLTLTSNALGTVNVDNAIETLNVASAGSANSITLGHSANTLNISGTAAFTDASANTTSETITSTSTGAVTLTSNNANAVTYTGGDGADTVTFTEGAIVANTFNGGAGNDSVTFTDGLTIADVVNGGAGTDTLVADEDEVIALTAAAQITNIEALSIIGAQSAALNISTFDTGNSIDTLNLAAAVNAGGITFGAGSKTINAGAQLGAALNVTSNGTGTADVLTVNNTDAAADAFNGQNIATTGYETVSLTTTGTGAATAQTTGTITLNATAGTTPTTTLNVSGSNAITTGIITANVIDASGLTGTATFTNVGATVGATSITGGANADTLVGSATATTLNGGAGNDTITGGAAADTINGGAGNDNIVTAAGNDIVDGGAGNDTITGNSGNQTLNGGDGNDTIVSGTGNDVINGGAGDDTIDMDSALTIQDTVVGGAGTDTLVIDAAATAATASTNVTGFETLSLRAGAGVTQSMAVFAANTTFTTIDAGSDQTYVVTNALDNVSTLTASASGVASITFSRLVDGTSNSLTVAADDAAATTDSGATLIDALVASNEETLTLTSGSHANETLTITALTAADLTTLNLTGTAAAVVTGAITSATSLATVDATGLTGAATVNASTSAVALTMTAGAGIATFTSGSGNDTLTGGASADVFVGGAGNDTLSGGAAADNLTGGTGNDTINGGAGGDTIVGGTGVDTITAGAGADTITGGLGADIIDITGTSETDTLIMTSGNASGAAIDIDVVTGFTAGALASGGDHVDVDISDINNALGGANRLVDSAQAHAAADDTPILTTYTGATDMGATATDIVVLSGNFASTDEVETAIESGGSHAFTANDANDVLAANDAFLLIYDNDVNSFIATAQTSADPGDNTVFAAGSFTVTNIMQFSGVADATAFVADNFDFIT